MSASIIDRTTSGMGWRVLARAAGRQNYSIRLARGADDLRAAQALRFEVFNLELNEGLDESFSARLDADCFDPVCDHLLAEEKATGKVVGTYRLQTGRTAEAFHGYYSENEFDFAPFEERRDEILELGRACVAAGHRNVAVLGLLWQGIVAYARERDCRYLIGCSSLTSQDPREGASLYASMARRNAAPLAFQTCPHSEYACPLQELAGTPPRLPKLLAAYLSVGAVICGPPALDRRFKTIDFLTLLDLDMLPVGANQIFQPL